jgi:3-oxoacyl-[acyl-carrier-protein] synthase II
VWARPGARAEGPPKPDYDRVVVTGVATLTTAGTEPEELWQAFEEHRVTPAAEDGRWIGRVDLDASKYLSGKERRRVDRIGVFSVITSRLALADAGIEVTDENRDRIGVIIGTGVGPMESMESFSRPVFEEGPSAASPGVFPNTVYNAAGGQVAIQVGAVGPASTVTAGHAAAASALAYAFDLAASGQADAVVCLAADTLTDTVVGAYDALGVVTSGEPGSAEADGFALSEGCVGLLLERLSSARERGARIYGEVLSYGITSDALGVGKIDTEGHGLERAMILALERAGVDRGDVTAVWSAASGLAPSDEAERAAIGRVFGENANVLAPKVLLGEPIGAGASLNAALALLSWQHGRPAGPVLVNSLSLGGTNFSVLLAPFEESS